RLEVVIELQLVLAVDQVRRYAHLGRTDDVIVADEVGRFVERAGSRQRQGFQVLVVRRNIEARLFAVQPLVGRVAIAQVERHAVAAPDEQVRRGTEVQRQG